MRELLTKNFAVSKKFNQKIVYNGKFNTCCRNSLFKLHCW